nr:hypothetical protein [Tanacetum cinerariifolium]
MPRWMMVVGIRDEEKGSEKQEGLFRCNRIRNEGVLVRCGTKVVCRKVCDFEIRNQNNTQGLCRMILRFQRKPKSKNNTQGEKRTRWQGRESDKEKKGTVVKFGLNQNSNKATESESFVEG